MLMFKKKKYLEFNEFTLFCYGVKPERKRFTTFNQHMFNTGVALDGRLVTSHPELLQGWAPIERADAPGAGPFRRQRAAIVAHVYYEDTWPDIAGVLKRLSIPFDLIVTTVPGRDRLVDAVVRDFPGAEVVVTENRGRDVRPFLDLLELGRLDRYRYVCKIHGKKSNDGGRISYLGALWRRRSLFDLLAGPGIAEAIVRAFEADPSVGIIGPRAFRLPSETSPLEPSWGKTRPKVLELAAKMGVAPEEFRLDFYGGTMFWARPEALRPLRELKLARAFPEEQGLLDGGLEHATERLFTTSAVVAGFKLADSDGYEVTQGAAVKDREAPAACVNCAPPVRPPARPAGRRRAVRLRGNRLRAPADLPALVTRSPTTPAAAAAPMSASLSPIRTASSGPNPKSRIALVTIPGAGLRQAHFSSGPCGQT